MSRDEFGAWLRAARIATQPSARQLTCYRRLLRLRCSLWLPPFIYMAAIFYFSSQSDPLPAVTAHVWDKMLHTIEYGGLGLLLCRALIGEGFSWKRAALLAVVLTAAYGSTDEWHQLFTPGRSSDVQDLAADTIGGAAGCIAYAVARKAAHHRVP
jgi:hypothetical protein